MRWNCAWAWDRNKRRPKAVSFGGCRDRTRSRTHCTRQLTELASFCVKSRAACAARSSRSAARRPPHQGHGVEALGLTGFFQDRSKRRDGNGRIHIGGRGHEAAVSSPTVRASAAELKVALPRASDSRMQVAGCRART